MAQLQFCECKTVAAARHSTRKEILLSRANSIYLFNVYIHKLQLMFAVKAQLMQRCMCGDKFGCCCSEHADLHIVQCAIEFFNIKLELGSFDVNYHRCNCVAQLARVQSSRPQQQ